MSGNRKPTHNVKVFESPDREGDKGQYVGVGWEGRDGSISIKLNPGVCLTTVGARVVIFKRRERNEERRDGDRPGRRYD